MFHFFFSSFLSARLEFLKGSKFSLITLDDDISELKTNLYLSIDEDEREQFPDHKTKEECESNDVKVSMSSEKSHLMLYLEVKGPQSTLKIRFDHSILPTVPYHTSLISESLSAYFCISLIESRKARIITATTR